MASFLSGLFSGNGDAEYSPWSESDDNFGNVVVGAQTLSFEDWLKVGEMLMQSYVGSMSSHAGMAADAARYLGALNNNIESYDFTFASAYDRIDGYYQSFGELKYSEYYNRKIDLSTSDNPFVDVVNLMTNWYGEYINNIKGNYYSKSVPELFELKGPVGSSWTWSKLLSFDATYKNYNAEIFINFEDRPLTYHNIVPQAKGSKVVAWDIFIAAPKSENLGGSIVNQGITIRIYGQGIREDVIKLRDQIYGLHTLW